MFVARPSHARMAERPDVRSSVHIPMVYEKVVSEPLRWEYHVLTIDTSEESLPDASQFNALGKEGWILAGMLDERATGKSALVYYYFVRQLAE